MKPSKSSGPQPLPQADPEGLPGGVPLANAEIASLRQAKKAISAYVLMEYSASLKARIANLKKQPG